MKLTETFDIQWNTNFFQIFEEKLFEFIGDKSYIGKNIVNFDIFNF